MSDSHPQNPSLLKRTVRQPVSVVEDSKRRPRSPREVVMIRYWGTDICYTKVAGARLLARFERIMQRERATFVTLTDPTARVRAG
jgi:hypothetical protein